MTASFDGRKMMENDTKKRSFSPVGVERIVSLALAPCPFCGSKEVRLDFGIAFTSRCVTCSGCETDGPYGDTKEECAEKWNSRPQDKRLGFYESVAKYFKTLDGYESCSNLCNGVRKRLREFKQG